jgi:hypothetical protein
VRAVEVPHSCAKNKNAHEWATPAVVVGGPPAGQSLSLTPLVPAATVGISNALYIWTARGIKRFGTFNRFPLSGRQGTCAV